MLATFNWNACPKGQAKEFRELNYSYRPEYLGSAYAVYDRIGEWLYQCSEGDVPESSKLYRAIDRIYSNMAHSFFRDMRDRKESEDAATRRDLQKQIDELAAKLTSKRDR